MRNLQKNGLSAMRLVITGVTRTGNLGGTAMLCAVEDVLRPYFDDIALASILPEKDRKQVGPDTTRLVSSGYRYLLLLAVPLCILFWPLRKIRPVRNTLAQLPLLKDIAAADAVADLSGIAFVDGRGIPLLYYNVAVALPAFFFGTPVYKLSQAMGPFRGRLNAFAAKWTLRRCATVAARGNMSLMHLKQLGIANAQFCPDTSFALQIDESVKRAAQDHIKSQSGFTNDGPLIVCSPSAVVLAHCKDAGVDMVSVLTDTFASLIASGNRVAMLPHSIDSGIRKNDDHSVARRIQQSLRERGYSVPILDPSGNPRLARALVGQSAVFIASRFHSMIAALSQSIPVVTVGWSHKYAEAAEPFGMSEFTMDYSQLTSERLISMLSEMLIRRDKLHDQMKLVSADVSAKATDGIKLVVGGA
ncbi:MULTISPECIES: polysaccharide pyruvyl transferase family protein [unclassified Rhizobium]|uniref:polysaccharide pyruvyl transferase family protein n=1 Tax=unclassified Rhizobium TaxID=2613769 RepID=UPI001405563B|nr:MULTISPECIES: polysaccharide pyruvyl transferase family protein [unclassified Rhizobium]